MKMGSYIYRKSFYHAFDSRAKLLFSLLFSIALIVSASIYHALAMAAIMVLISFLSLGMRETLMNFKRILLLIIFIILFSPLSMRTGRPLVTLHSFTLITYEGAFSSLMVLLKFIGISFTFSLLLETERMEDLIRALRYFKVPYGVSITISMTLSLIPALIYRYSEIREAMALRGIKGRKGAMMAPLSSLIVSAVKMIPDSASMLEERGFTSKEVPSYKKLDMNAFIFTQIAISVIIPVIFIIWR